MKLKNKVKLENRQLYKLKQIIIIGLILLMMWFIYQISPRITQIIQDMAKYLYELDSIYITRFIEIFLVVSFIMPFSINKNEKEVKKNG